MSKALQARFKPKKGPSKFEYEQGKQAKPKPKKKGK